MNDSHLDVNDIGCKREIRFLASATEFGLAEDIPLEITIDYGEDDETPEFMPAFVWVFNSWVRRQNAPKQYFLLSTNVTTPFVNDVPEQIVRHLKTDADSLRNLRSLLPELRQPPEDSMHLDLTAECAGSGLFDPTAPAEKRPLPIANSMIWRKGTRGLVPGRNCAHQKCEIRG